MRNWSIFELNPDFWRPPLQRKIEFNVNKIEILVKSIDSSGHTHPQTCPTKHALYQIMHWVSLHRKAYGDLVYQEGHRLRQHHDKIHQILLGLIWLGWFNTILTPLLNAEQRLRSFPLSAENKPTNLCRDQCCEFVATAHHGPKWGKVISVEIHLGKKTR